MPELAALGEPFRSAAVTAWVTAWRSSPFGQLTEIPMGPVVPNYSVVRHQSDVAVVGLELANIARQQWQRPVDHEALLAILLLHDVDAPLIYEGSGEGVRYSQVGHTVPHGVLGAMILRDVGFPESVTSIVRTHWQRSPFHVDAPESWILYYADLFAADHALALSGRRPLYLQ
jgi:putative nucleotidyltransferase with HDIG domain